MSEKLNAKEKQFQSSSHSFIYRYKSIESKKNLFIQKFQCQSSWFTMGGGLFFIYLLRVANPNLLFHPTVEIITSSMVEINFTWINT